LQIPDSDRNLSPWFSMWCQPKRTVRQIATDGAGVGVLLMGALIGLGDMLDQAYNEGRGDDAALALVLLSASLVGSFQGVVWLIFNGYLLSVVGRWLGGKARTEQTAIALAYSNVPIFWAMLLWVPIYIILGGDLFKSEVPASALSGPSIDFVWWVIYALGGAAGVWSLVLLILSLSEVHEFSAWRAVLTILLGWVLYSILALTLEMLMAFASLPFYLIDSGLPWGGLTHGADASGQWTVLCQAAR